ncbi:hypothetical protein L2E82_47066 [Cichorium intybus]|uniref:Uncharacterized protein n=1 Tax=Cichorium intybus TaxID=13427 RepID=A0ACB8YUC2_CICIN|nr:hypothetical protein L2E82_47066 [Cichorium intybus]
MGGEGLIYNEVGIDEEVLCHRGGERKSHQRRIIGRKTNPQISFLEIEKLYNKKGLKAFNDIEELPFDVSDIRRKPKYSIN